MKLLHLLRHAQAESTGPRGDISRHLTPGGRADAIEVGHQLAEAGIQLALVSAAVRTRETFDALGLDARAEFMEALYDASPETILQRISEVDEAVERLLVVGHSPGIPSTAAQLTYDSDAQAANDLQCSFPTSTLTTIEIDGPWAEIGQHPARLQDVTRRG